MTQPLGEEFILVRPSLAGFKAELQAQVAAALAGVGPQIAAAQSRLRQTAGTATLAGLPASTNAATAAQAGLIVKTKATNDELARLNEKSRGASDSVKNFSREMTTAETAVGRTTRGLVAATAASTGFFRAVSFASGAFLVGAAAGAALATGVQEFRQMTVVGAQTAAILKATGDAANVSAGQIQALASRQLRLTGVDDELVKSAANVLLTFRSIRNEVGAGNDVFTRSVKAVQDISSVFGTVLTGSAVQLGKALQDPIRGVTALRRSGITLSQSQRDLIKRLVETGRLLTAQKIILGEVEHQVGGTAAAIGRTLPGQLDVLKERAKNALGDFVKRISESDSAAKNFSATMHGLGDAVGTVAAIVKTSVGSLVGLKQTLGDVPLLGSGASTVSGSLGGLRGFVRTLGIGAAAFGAVKLAAASATAATGFYTRATTLETTADIQAAAAARAKAVALAAGATRAEAAVAADTAAAEASTVRIGAGAGAIRLLTNPVLLATVGITALTVGFIKLREAAANAPGTLHATERALRSLNDAVEQGIKLQNQLAGRREDVSLARFNVLAAQRDLNKLQSGSARSGARPGSLEARDNAQQIALAQEKLTRAGQALAQAEQRRDRTLTSLNANERTRPKVIEQTNDALQRQLAALRKFANAPVQSTLTEVGATNPRGPEVAVLQAKQAQAQLVQVTKLLNGLAGSGDRVQSTIGKALLAVLTTLNKIPSSKQFSLVVKLAGEGKSLNQIVAEATRTQAALKRMFVLPGVQPGLLAPGNLDILNRKVAHLRDGAIATVKSFSIGTDKGEVLLPSVINGQIVSTEKAIEHFNRTGENLGLFKNVAAANRYAEALHRQQDEFYRVDRAARVASKGIGGFADTEQIRLRGQPDAILNSTLHEQRLAADARLAAEEKILKVLREGGKLADGEKVKGLQAAQTLLALDKQRLTNARDALQAARDQVIASRQALADARFAAKEAKQAVIDAVTSGRRAVTAAVQSAKDNLQSLGQTVAEALVKEGQNASTITGAQFRRIRSQILAGGGGPETQLEAQRLANQGTQSSKLGQQINDVVDAFERGKIKLPQFNREFNNLIKGFDPKKFAARFGSAAANAVQDAINSFRAQAGAIATGPQRRGGAQQPGVIDPARALKESQRAITSAGHQFFIATRDIGKAERDLKHSTDALAKAERDLRIAQARETKANTAAIRANTRVNAELLRVSKAHAAAKDPKPKPKGTSAKDTGDLSLLGATSP